MARLVIDIETNAILSPDKLWCVVTQDVDTGAVNVYREGDYTRLVDNISLVDSLIGHNLIHYDLPILSRMVDGFTYTSALVVDTLILSRLYHFNIRGGHTLKMWGERFGDPKIEFDEFDVFSEEMLTYCKQDVALTVKLYKYLNKKLGGASWVPSRVLEHKMAYVCEEMTGNGFKFDLIGAKKLLTIVNKEKEQVDGELQKVFRPITKLIKVVTPRETKGGGLHSGDFRWMSEDIPDLTPFTVGCAFSRFRWVPFNPQSPKQIVERVRKWGWKPFDPTITHSQNTRKINDCHRNKRRVPQKLLDKAEYFKTWGWKVNKENLLTLSPAAPPECKYLVRRLLLGNRASTLESWMTAYAPTDGKIHGQFLGLGCWTHRMAHRAPNMGNIPRTDAEFGHEMRSLWLADSVGVLVGCDASGIQLRILAHYLENEEFTHHVCNGTQDDLSDIHNVNAKILEVTREQAKTWIYAWLLGAGRDKMGQILGCTATEAMEKSDHFLHEWEGLLELRHGRIAADGDRGYIEGLDGRKVVVPSTHHVLPAYLQNGESIIMKRATMLWRDSLKDMKVPYVAHNLVHDEWQTSTTEEHAETVGQVQCVALHMTGHQLSMKCPLDGNYKIGRTWSDTH